MIRACHRDNGGIDLVHVGPQALVDPLAPAQETPGRIVLIAAKYPVLRKHTVGPVRRRARNLRTLPWTLNHRSGNRLFSRKVSCRAPRAHGAIVVFCLMMTCVGTTLGRGESQPLIAVTGHGSAIPARTSGGTGRSD